MIPKERIDEQITIFKKELAISSSEEIVQKHIISGDSLILDPQVYHTLKLTIAEQFNIHPNEVLVVGSAKLGFSVAPYKQYRHFGDSSDIDIVIVSSNLFDKFWKSVYNLWREKVIWETENDFKRYLFQGWIRPDKLPISKNFHLGDEWWNFYRKLTSGNQFGSYKINGAIYKDWDYLQGYQNFAVQHCKNQLQ